MKDKERNGTRLEKRQEPGKRNCTHASCIKNETGKRPEVKKVCQDGQNGGEQGQGGNFLWIDHERYDREGQTNQGDYQCKNRKNK